MRFLCDADVDGPLVTRLRDEGHEVFYMTEIKADSTDDEVLALATAEQAVLVRLRLVSPRAIREIRYEAVAALGVVLEIQSLVRLRQCD